MDFSRLDEVERRFEELTEQMGAPEVAGDPRRYQAVARERSELEQPVTAWRAYKRCTSELEDTRALLDDADPDVREMARSELAELEQRKADLEEELRLALLPRDPNDDKNVVLEIRAGTGGDEATLFAADLLRMYLRYAEHMGWRVDSIDVSHTEVGGYKEVIVFVAGERVYAHLKFESGVHRVQRVPSTESGGRIHTSACSVAVLPEAEEAEIQIEDKDLRIDTFRASGPGGQSVNTTDSAVRVTHVPTGVVVSCQDEKSQHKNRSKALKVLASRLQEMERARIEAEETEARRKMVGSGDRSERIRTYNFPQNRLTDHRIPVTFYKLGEILEGPSLEQVIDACTKHFQAQLLEAQEASAARGS